MGSMKKALKRRLAQDLGLQEGIPLITPGEVCATGPSESFLGHCDDISSGASSVRLVMRRICDRASDEGTSLDPALARLSSVSGHNNVRDFWSQVAIPVEIESINVPVQSPKPPHALSMKSFPIVHPHRVLSYLFDHVGIDVPDSAVREYWQHCRAMNEDWAIHSPASNGHIPIGLHGDSARLWTQYKVEKVVAIFMNIILFRPVSVRHSRFLLFTCPSALMVKNRTLNAVWRRLVWSFNAAFEGINPLAGVYNRPLTGKALELAGTPLTTSRRKFAVVELRGDWEWHRDVWRTTGSWKGIKTCFRCPALSKGPSEYLYHNIEDDCQWVNEEFSHEEFFPTIEG